MPGECPDRFIRPASMFRLTHSLWVVMLAAFSALAVESPVVFPPDPQQRLERTCFQTGAAWSAIADLRSDVVLVYGIDPGLPQRIQTWRDHGYRIHVMTGVSWGSYQDYLYGRFDGANHEDEAQTVLDGKKASHGGDVYYMCPGTNYGKYLCQRSEERRVGKECRSRWLSYALQK